MALGGEFFYPSPSAEKHPISTCGLVCRYWENICRRRLFYTITLRSHQDLDQFADILDAPPARDMDPLPKVIMELRAEPSGQDVPWLHLAPSSSLARLPQAMYGTHYFTVDGSKLRSEKAGQLKTLHPAVPRTLPSAFSPVTQLALHSVHFLSGPEFAKLIGGLIFLQALSLKDVTWGAVPSEAAILALSAPKLENVLFAARPVAAVVHPARARARWPAALGAESAQRGVRPGRRGVRKGVGGAGRVAVYGARGLRVLRSGTT